MTPNIIGFSFILLGIFLIIGKILRSNITGLRKLFLPSSIIAGFVALFLGPEILGRIVELFAKEETFFHNGLIPEDILSVWSTLPGLFINIVFAALFLGKVVPNLKKIWLIAGPQVVMGQTVSWGQYVVGLLLTIFILTPFFGMNPLTGALIEISFVGGHGTAAGLSGTFEELGFAEGADLAVGLATIGIVSGVIVGIIIINWGARTGRAKFVGGKDKRELTEEEKEKLAELEDRETNVTKTKQTTSMEPLAFHLAIVGAAIALGYVLLELIVLLERYTWGSWTGVQLFPYVPLFPLAMVGGMVIQIYLDRTGKSKYIDREMVNRISGFSLDILIVSALASLSLAVIGDNLAPFLLLAVVAIGWNVFAFLVLAPRMIPQFWFERGIGDLGQAMGMTATGLLLMKIADPDNESPALEGFGYKQILFEPLVGGGIFTAASLPLIYQFGAPAILVLSIVVMTFFLLFGLFYFGGRKAKA
ncbi:sodium:glutamate symporter [Anaerobacillus alkaliphilus]|uniref:Sodium:glutamate symporter n=1 Tax=Anaerobacillus alkaliphilus TaxID=1548597 RepID=A0A4Q0VVK1_9BACI|nr:sodium/glutamate symporter [Anaerobacillus alkaliphilus]RXJ02807.1 sodium:glutamate symporter [Anaerobacillus alkaliphilus]